MAAVWLVDMGYVVKAAKDRFKLDYLAARDLLTGELGLTTVYLFNGYDVSYGIEPGLKAFYDAMRDNGVVVRLHPMEPAAVASNRQRRVDVDIAAHLVWQAGQPGITDLVLTTGDQDLIPAVRLAQEELSQPVILYTYELHVSAELSETASEHWLFEEDRGEVERV